MSDAYIEVLVGYEDFMRAHDRAINNGASTDTIGVYAEVDIDEALEHATIDQLREALGREAAPEYSQEQIAAIQDCFAAVAAGDCCTARALLTRIFDYPAQIAAAEAGIGQLQRIAA